MFVSGWWEYQLGLLAVQFGLPDNAVQSAAWPVDWRGPSATMSQEENLDPDYQGPDEFVVRERYFTPVEAAALLPEVVELVKEVRLSVRAGRELLAREQDQGGAISEEAAERLIAFQDQINAQLAQIRAQGVDLKGIEPALLDFPALRYGQEVYLCWREGDEVIEFWHPRHTGIAGRQPLAETQEGAWEWCN
ncbi:MAG TPA: hypothetical protein DIU15_03875 [Deltaproteobacteria bacterium]|nr:hypothetical protein [Deltaproteobacteria bacterium]